MTNSEISIKKVRGTDNIKELQQNRNEKGEGEDWKEKPKYEN